MQIDFLVENQIKHSVRLNLTREELFPDLSQDKKQKFKIPIFVNTFLNNLTIFQKNQIYESKVYDDFDEEESESSYSSDSFDAHDDDEIDIVDKIQSRPKEDDPTQEDFSKVKI